MSSHVLILGANGRCGRAAVTAFTDANWRVRTLTRAPLCSDMASLPVDPVRGDALQPETVCEAAEGVDVIVNAVNPPYRFWQRDVPVLTANCILAAKRCNATLMLPGNVYPFGSNLPARLDSTTQLQPDTPLAHIRSDMENAYERASEQGQQVILLRAGDFIEGQRTGNWFEDHLLARLHKGVVTYPGPLDRKHAWAWLPDFASAMVKLAERRTELQNFESVGFSGWTLTGAELVDMLVRHDGRRLTVKPLPWPLLKLASLFSADLRGVTSLRYLWQRSHQIDSGRLQELLPDFIPISPEEGLAVALSRLHDSAARTMKHQ